MHVDANMLNSFKANANGIRRSTRSDDKVIFESCAVAVEHHIYSWIDRCVSNLPVQGYIGEPLFWIIS